MAGWYTTFCFASMTYWCAQDTKICHKLGVDYARGHIGRLEDSAHNLNQSLANSQLSFGQSLNEFRQMRKTFKHALENDVDRFLEHRMKNKYYMYTVIVDHLMKTRKMNGDTELRSNLNLIKEDYMKKIHDIHKKFIPVFIQYSKLTSELENNKTNFDVKAIQRFSHTHLVDKKLIDKTIKGDCSNAVEQVHTSIKNDMFHGIRYLGVYRNDFVKKMSDILMKAKESAHELARNEIKVLELLELKLNEVITTKKKIESSREEGKDLEKVEQNTCENRLKVVVADAAKESHILQTEFGKTKKNLDCMKGGFKNLITKLENCEANSFYRVVGVDSKN